MKNPLPPFEKQYSGKIKEVFAYITFRCNMSCLHCYLGEASNLDMSLVQFKPMLAKLKALGASKITFLGGEPTLHPLLFQFIETAKNLGFVYIRLDTNGQFQPRFLENPALKYLNDISFSLEGIDSKTYNAVRRGGSYGKVMSNIKKALTAGYVVRVTMTANSLNLPQIEKAIAKLEMLGVAVLNLHLVSNDGRAKQNRWLAVDEKIWLNFYNQLAQKLKNFKRIQVKIPIRFIAAEDDSLKGKITCEAAKASRILIGPDLKIYACPLLLSRKRHFAIFKNGRFCLSRNAPSNTFLMDSVKSPACPILMKKNRSRYINKGILPICVSYKKTNKSF